jgi:sporadic carbohydrate cluster 2OG-Fe(II) oxygenase
MTKSLFDCGYKVIDVGDGVELDAVRSDIFELAKSIFNLPNINVNEGFNYFHTYLQGYSLGDINQKRFELISEINQKLKVNERMFKSFKEDITKNIGFDVLSQKGCNFVMQVPGDPNPSELHRDAPPNSLFELVLWVPLVNAYKSKSMYILNKESTKLAYSKLGEFKNWEGFEKYCRTLAKNIDVPYGKAIIFHPSLLHGSDINTEKETRISLNMRFKNFFAPQGLKNQLQFFEILELSDWTKLGLEAEKRRILK